MSESHVVGIPLSNDLLTLICGGMNQPTRPDYRVDLESDGWGNGCRRSDGSPRRGRYRGDRGNAWCCRWCADGWCGLLR